jgi:hypothetical protein
VLPLITSDLVAKNFRVRFENINLNITCQSNLLRRVVCLTANNRGQIFNMNLISLKYAERG